MTYDASATHLAFNYSVGRNSLVECRTIMHKHNGYTNGSTPFSLFAQDPACKCVRRICGEVENGKKVAKSCIRLACQFDLNLLQRLLKLSLRFEVALSLFLPNGKEV